MSNIVLYFRNFIKEIVDDGIYCRHCLTGYFCAFAAAVNLWVLCQLRTLLMREHANEIEYYPEHYESMIYYTNLVLGLMQGITQVAETIQYDICICNRTIFGILIFCVFDYLFYTA